MSSFCSPMRFEDGPAYGPPDLAVDAPGKDEQVDVLRPFWSHPRANEKIHLGRRVEGGHHADNGCLFPFRQAHEAPPRFPPCRLRPKLRELAQESDVVFEEHAQVADAVLEHGHPLHAHAEGEPGVGLRVVAHASKHVGIDHAAAQDLHPARALAHRRRCRCRPRPCRRR